jgi:type IV fimbrial biogenesis protein FimT
MHLRPDRRLCPMVTKGCVQHGFTLIELMVAVAILAILAMLAAPSFNEAILSNRLASFSNNFVASANLARGEAIKRNSDVTLCIVANETATTCTTSGDWEQGWIVLSGSTVVQRQQALSAGYKAVGTVKSVVFQSVGAGATTATLKLCRATPSVGSQEREIKVSATGRTSVSTTKTGVCS